MPIKLIINHREVIGNPILNIIFSVISIIIFSVVFIGVMILFIPVLWFMVLCAILTVLMVLLAFIIFNQRTRNYADRQERIGLEHDAHK